MASFRQTTVPALDGPMITYVLGFSIALSLLLGVPGLARGVLVACV
jgi:hypothetical protein